MSKELGKAMPPETVADLTKREYAAIMAMQGLLTGANQVYHDELAKIAVEQADALLAALKEKL